MSAKDYMIAVTGLTNSVWICRTSKKQPGLMTDDRVKVDESHFIGIVLEWANGKIKRGAGAMEIKVDGKVVAEIKIDREALGLDKEGFKKKGK